jgi:hypothetical protein
MLFGCLLVLWLVGAVPGLGWLREPVWLLLATGVSSMALSYVVLKGPREELARSLSAQVADRIERKAGQRTDEDAEDAEAAHDQGPRGSA